MNQNETPKERRSRFGLARWIVNYDVKLVFVESWLGKPRVSNLGTTHFHEAYRWNSYHAARKYQRSHQALAGYTVFNLTELEGKAKEASEQIKLSRFDPS